MPDIRADADIDQLSTSVNMVTPDDAMVRITLNSSLRLPDVVYRKLVAAMQDRQPVEITIHIP